MLILNKACSRIKESGVGGGREEGREMKEEERERENGKMSCAAAVTRIGAKRRRTGCSHGEAERLRRQSRNPLHEI